MKLLKIHHDLTDITLHWVRPALAPHARQVVSYRVSNPMLLTVLRNESLERDQLRRYMLNE